MKTFARLKRILKNLYRMYLESGNIVETENNWYKWYLLGGFIPDTKLFRFKRRVSRKLAKAIIVFLKGLDEKVFKYMTNNVEGPLGKNSYTFVWMVWGYTEQFVLRLKITENDYTGVYGIWKDEGVYFDQNSLPISELNKLLLRVCNEKSQL